MVAPKYLPHVTKMLATPGLYVLHDPRWPDRMVPLFSSKGQVFSMNVDEPLDPNGFYPGPDMEGPIQCRNDRGTHVTTSAWIESAKSEIQALLNQLPEKRDWLDPYTESNLLHLLK